MELAMCSEPSKIRLSLDVVWLEFAPKVDFCTIFGTVTLVKLHHNVYEILCSPGITQGRTDWPTTWEHSTSSTVLMVTETLKHCFKYITSSDMFHHYYTWRIMGLSWLTAHVAGIINTTVCKYTNTASVWSGNTMHFMQCRQHAACVYLWCKKYISSLIFNYEHWAWSWSRFLGSQPASDSVINPVVGCHYFPPGPRLLFQPKRPHLAGTILYCLVTEAHMPK